MEYTSLTDSQHVAQAILLLRRNHSQSALAAASCLQSMVPMVSLADRYQGINSWSDVVNELLETAIGKELSMRIPAGCSKRVAARGVRSSCKLRGMKVSIRVDDEARNLYVRRVPNQPKPIMREVNQ